MTRCSSTRVVLAVVTALVSTTSCAPLTQGRSSSQLVIVGLLTARGTGDIPTTFFSGPLLSDVGRTQAGEPVHEDFGHVTLRVLVRDHDGLSSPVSPSPVNDVTVKRYRVVYRGTGGVDVPRDFDGAVTFTVPAGGTGDGVFELVRRVAKLERPLAALAANDGVLTVIADVTFFGVDQAGHSLSVTGSVQVNFAGIR